MQFMEWRNKVRHLLRNRVYRTLLILVILFSSYVLIIQQPTPRRNADQYVEENLFDEILLKKCLYRVFSDSILVLNFNFPFYANVDTLKDLYGGVFARVIACGPPPSVFDSDSKGPDIEFDVEQGHFSYHCLALAIEKYPDYEGYFYGQDDMIINWWTFTEHDRRKIWHGTKVIDWRQDAFKPLLVPQWIWWNTNMGITACRKYYNTLKNLADNNGMKGFDAAAALKTYMRNGSGRPRCAKGWSDFFHIPGNLSQLYRNLSHIAYSNNLYLEISVHNILRSMVDMDQIILLNGIYMPDEGYKGYTTKAFWKLYNHQIAFIHPYKFYADESHYSGVELKQNVIRFTQELTGC